MQFQEHVRKIVEDAAQRHSDNVTAATDDAEAAIRKLQDFDQLLTSLLRSSIREMVHAVFHANNVRKKREAGAYACAPKVDVANSPSVNAAYRAAMLEAQTAGSGEPLPKPKRKKK